MDNNIVISAPKSEGEMDDLTDLAHAWRFNTAKSWIKSIENDAMDYLKKYHRRRATAKRLSTASSVADKTGLLTGDIAGSLAASGVDTIASISLAACGASCGSVSSILTLIQKKYSSSAKIYMLYISAAESVASLQGGSSQALTDGELSI